jgi:phosphate transport system substrate-binding protein
MLTPNFQGQSEEERILRSKTVILGAIGLVAIALAGVGTAAAHTSGAASPQARATAKAGSLQGAGSSFVFPLVSQWIPAVNSAYGIKVTYGPIGSGGGITAISNRTVDFGASDAPMTAAQFGACNGCSQIPWALGATSIPYNVPGLSKRLRFNGRVLAGIFMNSIKKWDDPAIKRLNPGVSLPSLDITPIHRSDNSGTTYNFTEYLNSVSTQWKGSVGKGVSVNWPTGISARGSAGVAGALSHTRGGITYVDIAYSLASHFQFAAIQNRAGKYVLPGLRNIKAAAATIKRVAPNNGGISIVNPSKKEKLAYPICTFTYVIVPKKTAKAQELKTFIRWALTKGQSYGPKLLFQPIGTASPVVLRASLKALAQVHS